MKEKETPMKEVQTLINKILRHTRKTKSAPLCADLQQCTKKAKEIIR